MHQTIIIAALIAMAAPAWAGDNFDGAGIGYGGDTFDRQFSDRYAIERGIQAGRTLSSLLAREGKLGWTATAFPDGRADQRAAENANLRNQLETARSNGGKAKLDTTDLTVTGFARARQKNLSGLMAGARANESSFNSFGATQSWR